MVLDSFFGRNPKSSWKSAFATKLLQRCWFGDNCFLPSVGLQIKVARTYHIWNQEKSLKKPVYETKVSKRDKFSEKDLPTRDFLILDSFEKFNF